MKINNTLMTAACALFLTASGCSKKEEAGAPTPTPTATSSATEAAAGNAQTFVATAEAQTEVVKQKVGEVVTEAKAQASTATAQVQSAIDQARVFLVQNRWTEALSALDKLNGQSLTPEQQSLVDSLKSRAQQGVKTAATANAADQATKSIGGLIPGK